MEKAAVRVLLVDDDQDEYLIVGDLLRAACVERFDLNWVPTYEQGLEAIQLGRCDVCLVDYRLGQRSGLDLLAEVTAKSGHTQVILMTGEGDRGVDETAAKAGAADYLVKGELTAALLERSIRYAIEHGRTLQALRNASQLQSLNLAKSAFLAAMSHEMRTPMNAILGMTEMLGESALTAEQKEYVDVLRRTGSGLLALINDILDLSKIESGRLELEHVAFDLEEIVDQAIELIAVNARSKGLLLLSHLLPDVATSLLGDPSRLRQILINLLGNAVKFTPSGEVVLTVRNPASGESGQIEFAISDTGIGIPFDKLETIFDDFTQADTSTTRKYGGTGLGLGISRRLVAALGGVLMVSSSPAQGSTFSFTVPFDPAPESEQIVRSAPRCLLAKRVLLLDDNATSMLILRETLQKWGLESDAFPLPAEALTRLRVALASERPHSLAVIATSRPFGTDGFEAAAEITRIAPALPIVMLSSNAVPGDTARCAKARLSGYAVRPVAHSHLLRLMREAVETRAVPEPHPAGSTQGKEDAMTLADPAARPTLPPTDRDRQASAECVTEQSLLKILVVDDSPDNRLLIHAYLKRGPYQVAFEEDGKAAVERFANEHFDLILMDVQMPVMDGLAATRAIRRLERQRRIPILALTANTSFEDIEKSLNAGCNAHLSKPISKLDLLSTLKQHLQVNPPEPAQPSRIQTPPGSNDIKELLHAYLERRKKEIPEMLELLAQSDFTHLALLGHDLKGSGGGYGFPELTRLGTALEQFAKENDGRSVGTTMTELSNYLDRAQLTANT